MSRVLPQLLVFSYHKSGTTLFFHVMTKVSERLGLTLVNHYGMVEWLEPEPDIILLPHSVVRAPLDRPYRAIRLIRDPRDIWVSGYLYHLHSNEAWCINTDLDPTPPIRWPKVDHSVEHWPEDWKRGYLERLNGRSYQQNLLDRSLVEGLDFELDGYTGCTFATMREWRANGVDAVDIKLEDVMADFDGSMLRIFDHFDFTAEESEAALEVARSEDVRRMDDAAIAERPQINSRTISKWREALSEEQIRRFEERNGDLIAEFGYELASTLPSVEDGGDAAAGRVDTDASPVAAGDGVAAVDGVKAVWPRPAKGSAKSFQDLGAWLSIDGTSIRPTVATPGTYTFVVPPVRGPVRLESRFGIPVTGRVPCASDNRRLGLRVNEIAIRSDAGDIVIAADDPRLTSGWHDAEYEDAALWRWTDGSAALPWDGVSGPAIVTVRCGTFAEHVDHASTTQH